MKRGGCGKRCTAGRIVRGGGDGGIPSGAREAGLRVSLAVWLMEVSRNVCLGGPGLVCTQWTFGQPSIGGMTGMSEMSGMSGMSGMGCMSGVGGNWTPPAN